MPYAERTLQPPRVTSARNASPAPAIVRDCPRMSAQRQQIRGTFGSAAPVQCIGFLGTALLGAGLTLTAAVVHDLYQRYRRYIQPADASAAHLNAGGVHGQTENAALNVEQGLDTFAQAHAARNDRQDDTRAHLSPIGSMLSSGLRAGHSDKDEILMRAISSEFPGRDDVTEEELEFAIQKAIMGSTRTRGTITGAARAVGGAADRLGL